MKIHHYSYSSHRTFTECPYKFKLSKDFPDVKQPPNKYIEFGSIFHKEVDKYHKGELYNFSMLKKYIKEIPQDFYDKTEVKIETQLKHPETGEVIDTPFLGYIDGVNERGLYDLKTTSNDIAQSVLNNSDQITLYCYMWWLLLDFIPTFYYIIYSRNKNTVVLKETYRSKKVFVEFFEKMKEFDKKVKNDDFEKKIKSQCNYCFFGQLGYCDGRQRFNSSAPDSN
jgi:hypothetical protein